MSLPSSHLQSGLIIEFAPVTLPAFGGKKGYWSQYEKLAKDGITSLTVTPVLKGERLAADLDVLDLDCHFDPTSLPQETYGMVYGDGMFEENIEAWICKALGLPDELGAGFGYTEQGMQGPDYISMEPDRETREWIAHMSHHHILSLTKRPEIRYISIGDFTWGQSSILTDG